MLISEIKINGALKQVHTGIRCRVKLLGIGIGQCKTEEEYNDYVNSLKWETGIIELTPQSLIGYSGVAQFRREDDRMFPAVSVADFEVIDKEKSREIDYSKEIAFIYQDSNANDVAIYLGDIVKMKIENGQYITSDVRYDKELDKYYLQGVSSRYFFFIGCEVEKQEDL
ncbi:MAG: hypothetical protein PHC62_03835 [Candidatus Izemoplasmatales bacterium]|nr:hypothetical protein [Candidatus Izemoplasmatales bacterium]